MEHLPSMQHNSKHEVHIHSQQSVSTELVKLPSSLQRTEDATETQLWCCVFPNQVERILYL